MKAAGRFKVVKRTPGISTTDLVGRMLLCTRTHFIRSLEKVLAGEEGSGSAEERKQRGEEMRARIRDYASDATGLAPGSEVWSWRPTKARRRSSAAGKSLSARSREDKGEFRQMVEGKRPRKGQRVVYVDGGFDLFSSGHIEFLRRVAEAEEAEGRQRGWYDEDAARTRREESGEDYGPVYVVAGVHDDEVINEWKGVNYPIMNIFERGLCVLQCKVSPPLFTSIPLIPCNEHSPPAPPPH